VRLPVVLSREEVGQLLREMKGETRLMAQIMYGGGLRLIELLRLRVQDMDFATATSPFAPRRETRIE